MMNDKMKFKSVVFFVMSLLLTTLIVVGCSPKNQIIEESQQTVDEVVPTEEILPTETFTVEPTLEPSPTPTEEPTAVPTETATPEPVNPDEMINFWTVPIDSGIVSISTMGNSGDYLDSQIGYVENEMMNLQVPANYIVVEVQFNQPLPSGAKFQVLELDAVTPWLESSFDIDANDATSGVVLINHQYLINPPFWEITYHARVVDGTGTVYWEKDLRIFKALPNTCWDGSLPDPVTLYCKSFDGDWNYRDFANFNPYADKFTSGEWEIDDEYLP
jgi:hypothetical protein